MKKITIILAIAILIGLTACGGSVETAKGHEISKEDVVEVYMPDWYDIQDSEEDIYFFGNAEKKNGEMSFTAARSNAQLSAAQYTEVYITGLTKNYMEEVGVEDPTITALTSSAVKAVANTQFTGSRVSKRQAIKVENGNIKTFVRLSLPKDAVNKRLANSIKKEEALYNAFKASQSFQELEEEIKE